jgi:tetratricopeptide (TPR) repeat protein
VALYPGYWDAWAGKGRMERELGRTEEARDSYTRALQANAGYENGFFGLGLVYEKEERLADAEATYRRGISKNRDSLPLAYRLACVLADRDAPEAEAEGAWRRAIQLGPASAAAHAGYAEWRALRIEPAAAEALRVLAGRRGDEDVSFGSALAWEKACRASKSRDDFEELVRVAKANAAYRPRFERVRDALAKAIRD